jgi:UDP-N-acetylmuramate--alanine ligase
MKLQSIHSVYFIGIGGIGMSALARYFKGRGAKVKGYDKTETPLTKKLVDEGIDIHYEEDLAQIPSDLDLVVYTPAIPAHHQELQYLQNTSIPIKKRAEVLGIISRGMKTIAVAGTHGKTTTTTILTHLLREGGIACTAFLGGIALNFNSNFIPGQSDWVVVEADEYDRSFLHLNPDLAVVLSMDADHLDIYGDVETLYDTGFRAFAKKLKDGGKLIIHDPWKEKMGTIKGLKSYGIEAGDFQARNVRVENGFFTFDYKGADIEMPGLQFTLPGKHNVENATAAITLALELGVDASAIRAAMLSFKGIKRRFEFLFRQKDIAYIDDYAHHPSELKASIAAAKQLYPGEKVVGIFQPHLFSRTKDFAAEFAQALEALDEVILLPIYPARENPIPGVNSEMLLELMNTTNKKLAEKSELLELIDEISPKVLMTLGAGDIDRFREPLKAYFEQHYA